MNLEINNNFNNKSSKNAFSEELENYIDKTNTSFSIDRFEGDFAICEDRKTKKMVNIEKYILDIAQTKKEKEEIKNLVDNLFKRKE